MPYAPCPLPFALCAMPFSPSPSASSPASRDAPQAQRSFHLMPFPFALCLPREIHVSDSAAYFTGALYAMRSALCSMLAVLLGFGNSLSRDPIKLHQLTTRAELFYFVCRMTLALRLDVGRWSRILRVWEIIKNRDLTPDSLLSTNMKNKLCKGRNYHRNL